MKAFFAVQPKLKVALVLLIIIVMLLSGMLIERQFFRQVDTTSTSMYEDRLMPATFVYQITDAIHQRRRMVETMYLTQQPRPTDDQLEQISAYRQQTDSIIAAFQHTYLVKGEDASLERLVTALGKYGEVEQQLLTTPIVMDNLGRLERHLDEIRAELLQLSSIQTTVGKELLTDTEKLVAHAYALSNLQMTILIVLCLIVQVLLLSSKAIHSPVPQQPHLN